MSDDVYVGIDLGTTNSTATAFDGDAFASIRAADGGTITPSVVRMDRSGNVTVGHRATRYIDTDPANTHSEFKRLLGSGERLHFPACDRTVEPRALSAEVLRSIAADFEAQTGRPLKQAVISVPALFELPQTSATAEAARMAGFERVEMIQEPVASAIASGWTADEAQKPWLVFDLGGGTFDASLLETREGILRVIGHDGDNFLGGRDIDSAVLGWAAARLASDGVPFDLRDPARARAAARLRRVCEAAKIDLSRAEEAEVFLPALFEGPDGPVDVDLRLERGTLESLAAPIVDRAIATCQRLLAEHGVTPGGLERIVFVGGPSQMPFLRERVCAALGAPAAEGVDPMTIVSQGAAIFAMNAGLSAHPDEAVGGASEEAQVWLQFPAVTADLTPFLVGRVAPSVSVDAIVVERIDGGWRSEATPLEGDRTFACLLELPARRRTEMRVLGVRGADSIPLAGGTFTMTHGLSLGDPPLSRTIGVATARDDVRVFVERGAPLPMRRTFTMATVDPIDPADPQSALRIPIVQGEFPFARLCRLVGVLQIRGAQVQSRVQAGSKIQITVEVDRGGQLSAAARIIDTDETFNDVAHLRTEAVSEEALKALADEVRVRIQDVRMSAFGGGDARLIVTLSDADARLAEACRDIDAAAGGDRDAAQRARRTLGDLLGVLEQSDDDAKNAQLRDRLSEEIATAKFWVSQFGTPDEERNLHETVMALQQSIQADDGARMRSQLGVLRRIRTTAFFRNPGAWTDELDWLADRLDQASDPRRAAELVAQARAADPALLPTIVRQLQGCFPPVTREGREGGHGSGVA